MKTLRTCCFGVVITGLLVCGNLAAGPITLVDLPDGDTDTISIQLDPLSGAVDGVAGASVGWGFTVNWTSTQGDWVSFSSSSPGSLAQNETNPGLLKSYADFIGPQGGPDDFALSPGIWTETFDNASQGVAQYQIVSDPTIAIPGAQDTGQITFNLAVFNGNPLVDGQQIGDATYAYYGLSTAFAVTVDGPPASATPEPATIWLLLAGVGIVSATRRSLSVWYSNKCRTSSQ